jgi:hypothetical protein
MKARSRSTDTTLQRHVSFFDDNGDRSVDVAECTRGLKALGLPPGLAEVAALAIVAPLSIQTRGSLLAMSVDIDNIHKGRHDSDTGILDKRGRFNARRFAKVFGRRSAVDHNGDRAFTLETAVEGFQQRYPIGLTGPADALRLTQLELLRSWTETAGTPARPWFQPIGGRRTAKFRFTATELTEMISANRLTLLGTLVSTAEWRLLLALAADTGAVENRQTVPALSVARLKSFYDGTLFYTIAQEHA